MYWWMDWWLQAVLVSLWWFKLKWLFGLSHKTSRVLTSASLQLMKTLKSSLATVLEAVYKYNLYATRSSHPAIDAAGSMVVNVINNSALVWCTSCFQRARLFFDGAFLWLLQVPICLFKKSANGSTASRLACETGPDPPLLSVRYHVTVEFLLCQLLMEIREINYSIDWVILKGQCWCVERCPILKDTQCDFISTLI